jgi:hypothetical protein
LIDEILEVLAETRYIRAAGSEDFPDFRRVHDREQQVLHGHELVPRFAGRLESLVETDFEFAA